ncbi:uncharacterized protein JCM6883_003946 [Sporobolomyces salmoneus]|uniref:uncharacterized protein n=1 Tax=Sporobolomyces salmoneus TaxID=183962 RepID=UPI0031736F59
MVAPKSAGYSRLGDPNRENSAHAPSRIDIERNGGGGTSSQISSTSNTGSSFDIKTTKPITSSTFAHEKVFPLVRRCYYEVESSLDTAFTYEALTNADLDWKYVKPIAAKLTKDGKKKPPACLVYCLLVTRVQFLEQAERDLAWAGVNIARADLCEILAIKILSSYHGSSSSSEHLYVLVSPFNPWGGCTLDMFSTNEVTQEMLDEFVKEGKEDATNALELAIGSQARRFVRSPLVQHVVKAIYEGDVMYSLESNHALITDNYKTQPVVEIYDWRARPFLDHYRLRVPYVRKTTELFAFASVFVLFMVLQATYNLSHLNLAEILFIIWSVGFALDEFASLYENGSSTYFYGAFNVLDSLYCLIFFVYLGMRVNALVGGADVDPESSQLAFDVLSLAGCVLAPRLMIALIPDHVVVMALGKMTRQFALFMVLAALTASGFLVTFHILARGSWTVRQISWLMLRIWLSGAFLDKSLSQQFHPVFGPILMVAFAVLSQTLLLTILISLLSNTFASVQSNAETEIANQFAVRTMERVKSDPLTSYTTPVNIIAFSILFPLRFVASPRMLHKAQAFLARLLNLPVLLFLALRIRLLASSSRYNKWKQPPFLAPASTIITQTARGAQKAFESLTDYDWEEGGAAVRKVFEFEVEERVYKTEDERLEEHRRREIEEEEESLVKQKQKVREQAKAESASNGAGGGGGGWDLRTLIGAKAEGSKMKPSKTIGVDGKEQAEDGKVKMTKGMEERLERIEDALEILLTEMVRNRRNAEGKIEGTSSTAPNDL